LSTLGGAQPVATFEDAWKYCPEPGWLMWAMARHGRPFDARLSQFAASAVGTVQGLLPVNSQGAYTALTNFLNDSSVDLDGPLTTAKTDLAAFPANRTLSPACRATAALVDAIQCADENSSGLQRIEAADRATALAQEAYCLNQLLPGWPTGITDPIWKQVRTAWRTARDTHAGTVRGWVDPANEAAVKRLIRRLWKANEHPPAGAKDTKCDGEFGGTIVSPRPNSGDPWTGTSTQSGTYWQAYGTDNGTPLNRSAVAVGGISGSHDGAYASPTGGNQWAFQFSGFIVGESVSLTVTWTDSTTGNPTSQGPFPFAVAGAS
jgi:hypothetical protein